MTKEEQEQGLMAEIWSLADSPLDFVRYVFPWGHGVLDGFDGPRGWQREVLEEIGLRIRSNRGLMGSCVHPEMFREAIASGRGPGKSALVAWLIHWMMSCQLGSTTIVTANTETQLKSRTWAELGKWHTLAINSHWFERGILNYKPCAWFDEALRSQLKIDTGYYYAQAQLWSEENPDAFAGVHNHNGVLVLYDESSGIPAPIWKVTEGFFTEPTLHRYWFSFSNPRRNTGAFFECFHKNKDFWLTKHIDSRSIVGIDQGVLDKIIKQFGEDSDEARVEVYGQFPKQGENQMIGRDIIQAAAERDVGTDSGAALIMGCDIARGGDNCVIRWRQGRDARSIKRVKFSSNNDMTTAYRIAEWIDQTKPDAVCIDAGAGTGVIDRLRELNYQVHEIWFGSSSPKPEYQNLRVFMWASMRDWLPGGMIDDDDDLKNDLGAPETRYKLKNSDAMGMESKEEMRKRGLHSPDDGDALALTFSVNVASRNDIEYQDEEYSGRSSIGGY